MTDNKDIIRGSWATDEPDPETRRLVEQARMAKRRHEVPCPDIDRAWAELSCTLPTKGKRKDGNRKPERRQLWGAAMLGAAAMLALVFLCNRFFPTEEKVPTMVLAYDNTPQYITLQSDSHTMTNLTDKDSVSYYIAPKKKNGSAATATEAIPTAKDVATPTMQRLATPRGMDFKITLPDGSEVWLNAASTIEFPSAFTSGERLVTLRGEAYFKVARDEEHPFIVSSEHLDVRVLGTEFNISAYSAEQSHVSLVKGSVEVLNEEEGTPPLVLHPGEEARRMPDRQLQVRKIDTYAVTQWVDGFFYFDNCPLIDVLRELGRWYNLGVVFRRSSMLDKKVHFSASRHNNVKQALNDLCQLLNVEIDIEGYNIIIQ